MYWCDLNVFISTRRTNLGLAKDCLLQDTCALFHQRDPLSPILPSGAVKRGSLLSSKLSKYMFQKGDGCVLCSSVGVGRRENLLHLVAVENGLEHIEKAITDGSGQNIIRKL